jgi:hypothetical protein
MEDKQKVSLKISELYKLVIDSINKNTVISSNLDHEALTLKDFEPIKELGQGGFSNVKLVRCR